MATAGDGRTPYESRGDGEKSRKRHCRPEIIEESQDVSQEAGPINLTGVPDQRVMSANISVTVGVPELEQMLKQMTFTRSEIQRLTVLLHSRACDNVDVERDATVVPITPMPLPQHPTTIQSLPSDLLINIFMRLLAKQLAQMRCVSKYWNFLLSQSSFVKSHLHRSIHNNDQILVVFYNNYSNDESGNNRKVFTPYLSRSPHLELTNFIKLPRVKRGSGHTYRMIKIIGSVQGLICSCYGDRNIHIWNPSLNAVSTLPPYSFPYYSSYELSLRFGYDPQTEDYKVVKITGLREDQASSEEDEDGVPSFLYVIKKWLEVEIYSMRTGSWKIITKRFPSHITRIFNKDEVCVDGHDGRIHWIGHTNEKPDSEMIVAFNLSSETFCDMTLPDFILDYNRSNTLGILGGKLCVTSLGGGSEIEVWVMDKYGVAESWVKRHTLRISHYLGDTFNGFTSHGEFLIEDADDRLVLYDLIADKANVLEEYCPGRCTDRIVECVDSLVWVAPPMR